MYKEDSITTTVRHISGFFVFLSLAVCGLALPDTPPYFWTNDRSVTLTSVLHHYILVCGFDYLCDKSKLPVPSYLHNTTFLHLNLCPRCFCDSKCLSRGNCCPDIYFGLPPLSCKEVHIMASNNKSDDFDEYLLVDYCPLNTDMDLDMKCQGMMALKEKLLLPPVTSIEKVPVTYLNKHCAKCNNVGNYSAWNLVIDCEKFADFNFLSSYEEILSLASRKQCLISFDSMENPVYKCPTERMKYENDGLISSCNKTGSWLEFDRDIQTACLSDYNVPFQRYKNIFCFLCNPSRESKLNTIAECNSTGLWTPFNQGLKDACSKFPLTPSTFPFKNIFCYLCNRNTDESELFSDVMADVIPGWDSKNSKFTYTFEIYELNVETFLSDLHQKNTKRAGKGGNSSAYFYSDISKLSYPNTTISVGGFSINVTNIVTKTIAMTGKGVCNPQILPPELRNTFTSQCSCEPTCGEDCCSDVALSYPVACMSSNLTALHPNRQSKAYLVIDKCYKRGGSQIFRDLCSSPGFDMSDEIYPYLPVNVYQTAYRNVYCYLCNDENVNTVDNVSEEIFWNIIPWEVNIACDTYLNYNYRLLVHDVIKTAMRMSCEINVLKDYKVTAYECNQSNAKGVIDKCNVTGSWFEEDPDVRWACEKIEPYRMTQSHRTDATYKNGFCDMCNRIPEITSSISDCMLTYDFDLVYACQNFPAVNTFKPYKNYFCKECNDNTPPGIHTGDRGIISPGLPDPSTSIDRVGSTTFRNLFALEEFKAEEITFLTREICHRDQVFDERKGFCRNFKCYPGKVLTNTSDCIPLLHTTRNLQYVLAVKLQTSSSMHLLTKEFLDILSKDIPEHLSMTLEVPKGDIDFRRIDLLADKPCEFYEGKGNNSYKLEVLMYFKFFIFGFVPRLETEQKLIDYRSQQINITGIFGEDFPAVIQASADALLTPVLSTQKNHENNCYLSSGYYFNGWDDHFLYRTVHVTELLTCSHVEFDAYEYQIDWGRNEMKLINYELILKFGEFMVMTDRKVRVCIETIQDYFKVFGENDDKSYSESLGIITIICLVISLVCLFLTLMTYCLFSSLRTLPGKNNMCLMSALFCAQLSTLLQGRAVPNTTECIVSGIFVHYFWLSTFGSLSVCSFQMYRIFAGHFRSVSDSSRTNKTVAKRAMCSFGTSALVVIAHVVVSVLSSPVHSPGYGGSNCFITHRTAFIVTLLVPLVIMCLLNILFFSCTAYHIKTTPKVQKNKTDKLEFLVYIKLFVVTGSTWLVQLLDSFLPVSFLSYAAAILNGLQGLFLFLSYVCNKRVFRMYRNRCAESNVLSSWTAVYRGSNSGSTQQTTADGHSTSV